VLSHIEIDQLSQRDHVVEMIRWVLRRESQLSVLADASEVSVGPSLSLEPTWTMYLDAQKL